jgi:hypothetical protein
LLFLVHPLKEGERERERERGWLVRVTLPLFITTESTLLALAN